MENAKGCLVFIVLIIGFLILTFIASQIGPFIADLGKSVIAIGTVILVAIIIIQKLRGKS